MCQKESVVLVIKKFYNNITKPTLGLVTLTLWSQDARRESAEFIPGHGARRRGS